MYRGTTPTIKWKIDSKDVAFEDISQVWMTFKNGNETITIDKDHLALDPEKKTVTYVLSQEETLKFSIGKLECQLRVLLLSGKAFATSIREINVDRILKGGVIS